MVHALEQAEQQALAAQQLDEQPEVTALLAYWRSMLLQHLCPSEKTACALPSEVGNAYLLGSTCNKCSCSGPVMQQLQTTSIRWSRKHFAIPVHLQHLCDMPKCKAEDGKHD